MARPRKYVVRLTDRRGSRKNSEESHEKEYFCNHQGPLYYTSRYGRKSFPILKTGGLC